MTRFAVVYYSSTGSVHALAEVYAAGAEEAGAEVRLRRAAEPVPREIIEANEAWRDRLEATAHIPTAAVEDLIWADGFALGTPTRFGQPAPQLKQFLDSSSSAWSAGHLAGKPASGFTSAHERHGGHESTLLALYPAFCHWGSLIVPAGGSPSGVSSIGGDGAPGQPVLAHARRQGHRLAVLAQHGAGCQGRGGMRAVVGSSRPGAEPSPPASKRRWWALGLLTGANLLTFASVTIMNVAPPQTQTQQRMTDGSAQAVITVYSLTFGTLILVGGRLADALVLRRCLTGGLIAFALASLLGGLAAEPAALLVARALQGGAAVFVAATAIPLMSVLFPASRQRSIAFDARGIVMGIGTAGSFLLGGAMADLLSWQWSLLINVPLALVTAAGIFMTIPGHRSSASVRVDTRGALLASVSLGLLVFGLDRASALGWHHLGTHALLAGGVVGAGLFVVSPRSAQQPLIPPYLMGNRARVAGYLAAFFAGIAMFAGMFVLTSFMQSAWDVPPVRIGLAFLPFAAGAIIVTVVLPRIRSYIAPGPMLAAGLLLAAGGLASLGILVPASGYIGGVLPAVLLLGSGGTVVMITAGDVATAGAADDSGVAGALVNSAQQIGAALGTAVLGAVILSVTQGADTGESEPIVATVAGYAHGGLVGAGMVTAAAIEVLAIRTPRLPGHREQRGIIHA